MVDVIPEGLEDLSPEEQFEWFEEHEVGALPSKTWEKYYCVTTRHKGLHCSSCIQEQEDGYFEFDDICCHLDSWESKDDRVGPT